MGEYAFAVLLLAIGVGLGGYLVLHAVRHAALHEHISASPLEIAIKRHGLVRRTRQALPTGDVEHVDLRDGRLRIIGPGGEVILAGSTLREEEREWVRDMIRHVITAPKRQKGGTSFY
jgi:hypothetical protein